MTAGATHTHETFPLLTADGVPCNVINVHGPQKPTKGPVLLVHGVGVRTEIWRPPNPYSLVDALLDAGYEVWMETWRASMDVPNNTWTLDQAAVLDHPLAVKTVLEQTGASSLQAITHCQGSTSFLMSVCAGLVPEVRTVVASAVTLHPVVPRVSGLKLKYVVPPVSRLLGYLDPQWGHTGAPWVLPKLLTPRTARSPGASATTACARSRASCSAPATRRCGRTSSSRPRPTSGRRASSAPRR